MYTIRKDSCKSRNNYDRLNELSRQIIKADNEGDTESSGRLNEEANALLEKISLNVRERNQQVAEEMGHKQHREPAAPTTSEQD